MQLTIGAAAYSVPRGSIRASAPFSKRKPKAGNVHPATRQGDATVSQPYVDGITDTVSHSIASSRQIAVGKGTLRISVVCSDRWFPGDFGVVTSRDGHTFADEVEDIDVWTGEVTIRLAGG
jgi:hypothetical protein